MVSEAQKRAKKRYDLYRTKQYVIRLRLDQDADVIDRLDSVPCKTAYIRKLVRNDAGGHDNADALEDACGQQ